MCRLIVYKMVKTGGLGGSYQSLNAPISCISYLEKIYPQPGRSPSLYLQSQTILRDDDDPYIVLAVQLNLAVPNSHQPFNMSSSTGTQDRAAKSPSPTDSVLAQEVYDEIQELMKQFLTDLRTSIDESEIPDGNKGFLKAKIHDILHETHKKLGSGDGSDFKNMNEAERLKLVEWLVGAWDKMAREAAAEMQVAADWAEQRQKKREELQSQVQRLQQCQEVSEDAKAQECVMTAQNVLALMTGIEAAGFKLSEFIPQLQYRG